MDDDEMKTAPDHEVDRSEASDKPAKNEDDPKGKTKFDKPATGEESLAIDEEGKNIRGPEGHAKDGHDDET
ncbi:hypothetical protein LX81_00779 [Palleronia aestuarii]|uniref:Uncharacterized protein n=1 Tax=Palleronia aestuarii TaxID=568105 RepID=A0A2W7NGU4_9RHOB|nr:hypothetical protein [Palleronia aestuarii]PZX19080.1 hypothetical protein LX81_00779 [Palleronia aestuarii]